jgi:threonine dehydratase
MNELEPGLTLGERYELEVAAARETVQDLSQLAMFNGSASQTMRYQVAQIPEMYGEGAVQFTPLVETELDVFHKDERQQGMGAFKARGAFTNGWLTLERQPEVREIVACSAGNHAQGVAQFVGWHNKNYDWGLSAHAFMAQTASAAKKDALIAQGATIHDSGFANLEEARRGAEEFAEATLRPAAIIDPYAAAETIAGQGTILTEIVLQLWELGVDTTAQPMRFFAGWGGGGKSLGQAEVLKQLIAKGHVHPESKIIAAQEEFTDSGIRGLERYDSGNTHMLGLFAPGEFSAANDGSAVEVPDLRNIALAQKYRDEGLLEFMRVSKAEVGQAMINNPDTEPAGALSIAGQRKHRNQYKANDTAALEVCVVSGGNLTPQKFAEYKAAAKQSFDQTPHTLGGYVLRAVTPVATEREYSAPREVIEAYLSQLASLGMEVLPSSLSRPTNRRTF